MWLTPSEAARYLKISRSTLYLWVKKGWVTYHVTPSGRGRRFRKEDLDAAFRRRERGEVEPIE